MESAGQTIKRYRERRKMTLEDVALGVGLTFGAVSQWENGRTSPRRANAYRLDELLGAGGEIVAVCGYTLPTGPDEPNPTNADLAVDIQEIRDQLEHLKASADPSNGALLAILQELAATVDANNKLLEAIAKRQGVPLPTRSKRAPAPRALNAVRRKDDRP